MSIESAKAFMEKVNTDKEFAKKISGFKNLNDLQDLIKKSGFDFTKAEFDSLIEELSDEALDNVAGGRDIWTFCW